MKTKLSILVTVLLFTCFINAQNVITVDNSIGANAQYSDLQTAIDAASNGDIIYVHASEINYGSISIDKALTIIGSGHSDPNKGTYINYIELLDNSSNSKFTGLNITWDFYTNNTNMLTNLIIENCLINRYIYFHNGGADNVIIRGNIIEQIGNGVLSSTYDNYSNAIISNNIILSHIGLKNHESISIKNNVFLSYSNVITPVRNSAYTTGDVTVQNCIIYASWSGGPGLVDANYNGVAFDHCISFNESGSVVNLNGTDNLDNQNPLFENLESSNDFNAELDDYHLQAGSPAIGSGAEGVDMGIYDGSAFTFNNFGYTNGIPTVKITNITDRIAPGANLNVTINTNAN